MKYRIGALTVAMTIHLLAFDDLGCTVWNDAVVPNGGGAAGAGGGEATSGSAGGGTGGAGGQAPATLLSISDAATMCGWAAQNLQFTTSLIASLAIPVGRSDGLWSVANQSECFTWLAGPIPSDRVSTANKQRMVLDSLLKAGDAGTATSLLPIQFQKHQGTCPQSKCDGSDAVVCGETGGVDVTDHCASDFFQNEHCVRQGVDRRPTCTLGICDNSPPTGCNGDAQVTYCNTAIHLEQSIDCGYQGLTCFNNACNNAGETAPPSCDEAAIGQVDCSGGTELRVCDGGFWVAFHCENVVAGSTCIPDAMLDYRCSFQGHDCTPNDAEVNICDGDSLVVCLAGKKTSVNCPNGCTAGFCAP